MRRTATTTNRLWRGIPSWQRSLFAMLAVLAALVQLGGSSAAPGDPPNVIGDWSAPFAWPIVAVHMSLTSTGEVFSLDGFGAALNSERVWNPQSGIFTSVPYGRNLFCGGHVQLPDGRTLIVGGHIAAYEGLADTTLFNANTDTYFRGADMAEPRWYPTATVMPDGKVLVFGGDRIVQNRPGAVHAFEDASVNSLPELYNPATNIWTSLTSGQLTTPLYPQMFVLSDGRVIDVGPDTTTRILTPGSWTWSTLTTSPFDGHSAVMYRPNKIMKSGTWADPDFGGPLAYDTNGRTAVLDMNAPTPTWRETSPMAHGRAYHNMTLLPDGTVLASGGSSRSDGLDLSKSVLPAEIWNPDTETWTEVDALQNGRQYHSTALLLPDGRVLMAGGGAVGGGTDVKNGEIYSPPYLFKGPRPVITTSPATMSYGGSFDVNTPNAAQIAHVSLIRSPSVTHAFDMNQRFQFLNFTAGAGKVTVTAPANSNLAPPGDYLLYLVDTNGVPSIGSFIRENPAPLSGDTTPPTVSVTAPASGNVSGTINVTANATDNDAVVGVQFMLDGAILGAEDTTAPYSIVWDTTTAPNGPHTLTALARDPSTNAATSASVPVTVTNTGPPPGVVAAYGFDTGSGTAVTDGSGNGNNGTLTNATWAGATAGRFGNALSFNGTNALVSIPDSNSLDLTAGMTIEAWLNPTALGNTWRTVALKEQTGYYAYGMYASTGAGTSVPSGNGMIGAVDRDVRGTAQLPLNTWTHLATTYDGSALRLYVNGTQVATLAATGSIVTSTGALKLGGNALWGEWYSGLIDELRVYNRALTPAEIQGDMTRPVTGGDTTAPSAPGSLGAVGAVGRATLSWAASIDNVGVVRYNVHRGTSAGFAVSVANRIAQPTTPGYVDTTAPGSYFYKVTAEDAAGNISAVSNEASATVLADTTAPSQPVGLAGSVVGSTVNLSWTASSDNVAVTRYNLHRSTSAGFTPSVANRIAQPTGPSFADTGLATGSYFYKVTAEDAAGNISAASNEATATVADASPPTAPSSLAAAVAGSTVNLSWATSTDNVGVSRYNLHRSTTSGFAPSPANRIAQPTGLSYADTGVSPGSYFYKLTAEDAAGNISPVSNTASATVLDTTAPSTPTNLAATGGAGQASLTWTAATDNVAVTRYNLHRSTTPGFTPTVGNRVAQPTITSYTDTGLAAGTYYYKLTAEDAAANLSPASNEATATVSTPPVTGLVAAYGFDTGSGTSAPDQSGTGNNGTLTNATWTTTSKYGQALAFNGTNASVTIPDTNSLDLTTGMTLEAWVHPTALGSSYRTAIMKEQPGSMSYGLYADSSGPPAAPIGEVYINGYRDAIGTTQLPVNTWTHLATTYNGSVLALYVNGVQAGQLVVAGSLVASTGALKIGGNSIWGEWFQGEIDEVRIYNRALSASEITGDMNTSVSNPDSSAPSAPGALSAVGGLTSAQLSWGAATDNVGVVRYNVHRGTTAGFTPSVANRIAQPTGLSYTDNVAAGTYFYRVVAEDAAGNLGPASNEASTTVGDTQAPSAPGSLGAVGAVGRATLSWAASIDNVGVVRYNVHRGTSAGFAVSVANRIAQPTTPGYVDTTAPGSYFYKVTAEDAAGNISAVSNEASATVLADTTAPSQPVGLAGSVVGSTVNLSWTASSDNVAVTRYNLHRSTSAGFTPSVANRIAQPTGPSFADTGLATGSYFYKVTAEDAAGNISAASNEATATVADASPPTAPSSLAAAVAGSTVNLSWATSTDNVGVSRYNLHRSTTSGFAPSPANRIAQPTGLSYADTGVSPGSYFYKLTAEDAAGNISPVSNTASATVLDTTAPSTPTNLAATGGAGQASLTWTAATDNVAVTRYNLHRSTTPGFTPTVGNRVAQPTITSYTDTGLAAGTYYYKLTAEDAAANLSPASNEATATVSTPPVTGLVAAYGFDTGSGTSAPDQSGTGNNGTLTNATWTTTSKYGQALAFNGTNASVTIPDTNSLDLTTGMTLEAWVHPTALGSNWSTAILKEATGSLSYGLYANGGDTGTKVPTGEIFNGGFRLAPGTTPLALNTWAHLATTYDGTTLRLFVNGVQAGQLAIAGAITSSTGALKIGGNSIWGEWFQGEIDEVRIYNRALSASEITGDMNTSITAPDSVPPSPPGTLTATGGLGQVGLSWGAATDNVGIARYNVHRGTSAGFTPSVGNRLAQPTGTTYTDSGLAAGTYFYKVTAEDFAGNVGPAGNEATGVSAADTTPPTVSITAPAGGATVSGTIPINASASDNGTVAGVQFKLDGANLGAEDTSAPYSFSWDTFSVANGSHTLGAVARDAAGNTTPATNVVVTASNTGSPGLVAAWSFDDTSGTTTPDQSGHGNVGTLGNATRVTTGKFNGALSFNGTNASVSVPDSATLDLTTGMTLEAWVRPAVAGGWRTAIAKDQPGNLAYGMYANTNGTFPGGEISVGGTQRSLNATSTLPVGAWSHVATTYDGATLRIFVNGTQSAQLAVAGSIATSTSALHIGGNGVWGEWFNGTIDEVRVYNRALSAAELQNDMVRSITPDTVAPTITARTPAPGSAGINAGTSATATFNELMGAGSFTASSFQLKDSLNAVVPTNVTYNPVTSVATLTPQNALQYGATYNVTVKGGAGGVTDLAGNPLAADSTWSFSVEASPPPILVVGSTGNPFGSYIGEILRNEGLQAFTTIDVAFVSPALLAQFDVVILGDTALSPAQVTTLTGWVNGGGNLVAMRPDKQLAGLLGLTDAGTTLTNAYLQVATGTEPGAGIVGSTIQFHGSADRYTLNGATSVGTLYSNATTATTSPAVTLRSVGASGGQAAAFTYDLARSVVYTRQGNPAWAGQERDGASGLRPDDLFYGAKAGDVQPDWIDTNKIAIPQADEQQRLLVNLITVMERDKLPMPHFWYLPRGEKAVVIMSGDDHSPSQAPGGTAAHFDRYKALSPPGCSVVNWDCVRASGYLYPNATLTNAQATSYNSEGFEVGLHPLVSSCQTTPITEAELAAFYDTQLTSFRAKYTGIPNQVSSRTHCVYWPDWASNAKVELARGIRMDANYYHYPGPWIGAKPGFMNGGGFPMRFADTDGTQIDVYQANTNMTDESTTNYSTTINALLDNAIGSLGYYGAFGANMHNDDTANHPGAETIIAAAQARSVPVVSYKQLLDWVDGRNSSTIRGLSWNNGTFTFVTTVGAGANGLQTMLPIQGRTGTLTGITRAGSPVTYTVQTVKGIQYAVFTAVTATFVATYA